MRIRSTLKLIKLSGLKPLKHVENNISPFPGEWYATLASAGRGKFVTLFVHKETKISILIQSKSLNKTLPLFNNSLFELLQRNGYLKFYNSFDTSSSIEIYTTNNSSTVSFMNNLRFTIEIFLKESLNLTEIEDRFLEWPFKADYKTGKYTTPKEILDKL